MTSPARQLNKMIAAAAYREWPLALAVSFGTALAVVAPFFWLGNASGHDFGFHAASWLDAAGQWREGVLFPRWTEWANYGFGEPRFIFYPPLSWILGAALSFVVPWNAVPGAFVVIVQALAGISLFALARRFLPRDAALLGAVFYSTNPYALLIVYMRSDFAEQLACALMPLVLLATVQLSSLKDNRRGSLPRAVAFFAVAFAVIWLSNAPAGVMASYSVALVFAWAAWQERSFRPLWRGATGLALGFGLTAFYLLPAAYEQRWVNISQVLSSGLLPADNFLFTMIADPEHNLFNWIASGVAVLLIVMNGIAAIAVHRKSTGEKGIGESENPWPAMLLLSAAAAFLMIRLSFIFWLYLPKLRFVQFPWRWMAILAVPYAYFLAAAAGRGRARWIWSVGVLIVAGGTATFLVQRAWWDSEDIPVLRQAIANDQGYDGTDEYDPVGDDHYNLPEKALRVEILPVEDSDRHTPKAEVRIVRWTAERRELRVKSDEPLRAALRLLNYPAWHVELNGKAITPAHPDGTEQMILSLSSGTQVITATFVHTPDRKLGMAISLLAMLTLLGLFNAGGLRLLSASP